MYYDANDTFEIERADFFSALALLRSTDEDSAEELRRMLDASIEKKFGPGRTLASRLSKDRLRGSAFRDEVPSSNDLRQEMPKRQKRMTIRSVPSDSLIVDPAEKGDIPRISIPDEGSADEALCKVCGSADLGLLLLLECQDCQDVYHPLCHQPPVLDVDVYDPRLVWRCEDCLKTVVGDAKRKRTSKSRIERNVDAMEVAGGDEAASRMLSCFGRSDSGPDGEAAHRSNVSTLVFGLTRDPLKTVQSGCSSGSSLPVAAHNQLRKRVGSKLTVARSSTK